ncbi:hypothetical protein OAB01_01630 [Bacteroidia bacterium]|nr:hypothetical protein [Bacteroidia bacterium]
MLLQRTAAKDNLATQNAVVKYVHVTEIAIQMVANVDVNAANKLYLVEPFGSTFFLIDKYNKNEKIYTIRIDNFNGL